jgi:hypothetical protein
MTKEIELAKLHGIAYRLTPEGTNEMWCYDHQLQAFAEALIAQAAPVADEVEVVRASDYDALAAEMLDLLERWVKTPYDEYHQQGDRAREAAELIARARGDK